MIFRSMAKVLKEELQFAGGLRKVRRNHDDKKKSATVLFDQGMYRLPPNAKTVKKDGEEWVECEAHVDTETGDGYAVIGGIKMAREVPFKDTDSAEYIGFED
jgi:hypothetical protein